jgi:hypothetical protein
MQVEAHEVLTTLLAKEVLKQAKALAPNDTGIDDMIQQCSVLEEEYAQENGTRSL